ncbi:MAG: hypothetical protein ACRD3V_02900 [Vicinamibacteria bacterium]
MALATGGSLAAEELWVPPTHFYPPGLDVFPWPTTGTGLASFGFAVPDDFSALGSVTVVLIPKVSQLGRFDVYGSVKREGQPAGTGIVQTLGIPATLTAERIAEIDVTTLLAAELDATSAGSDYVSVFFWSPTSPGLENATVLGLRFVYDAVDVATADIENDAVTNAKLADNSVGSDKVLNNSLGSEDIQNQSLTGTDIADASIGAADVVKTEIQQRVTETCPLGESIRVIQQGGGVVCEPDDDGVPIATLEYTSCSASTACKRTIDCPASKRVAGGGARLDEEFIYARYNDVDLVESYPNGNTSWTITLVNNYSQAVNMYIYATCVFDEGLAAIAAAPAADHSKRNVDIPLSPK